MPWFPAIQWERSDGGYRIEERAPGASRLKSARAETILDAEEEGGWYLVENPGERRTFDLGQGNQRIVTDFANCAASRGGRNWKDPYIKFAAKYGLPVFGPASLKEMPLSEFKAHASDMRVVLEHIRLGNTAHLLDLYGSRTKPRIRFTLSSSADQINLILQAPSLPAFIRLQALKIAESNAAISICPICLGPFMPKSSKRKWCSDACKQKEHRDSRTSAA